MSTFIKINNDKERPCFPSCFNWETSSTKRQEVSNQSDVYGTFSRATNLFMRKNFLGLAAGSMLLTILARIPLRIESLFKGDFIDAGKFIGDKEYALEKQAWSQDKITSFPSEKRRLYLQGKNIFIQLIKNVAKIVFYPLAALALTFIALYGAICNPWDARVYFAKVEYAFARDLPDPTTMTSTRIHLSEFVARCMQPQRVWEEYFFIKDFTVIHPDTLRSLFRELSVTFKSDQAFWENEGIDVSVVSPRLQTCQQTIRYISTVDTKPEGREGSQDAEFTYTIIDKTISWSNNQDTYQKQIVNILQVLIRSLKQLKEARIAHADLKAQNIKLLESQCVELQNAIKQYNTICKHFYNAWKSKADKAEVQTPWFRETVEKQWDGDLAIK
jgi:hypothetical protein